VVASEGGQVTIRRAALIVAVLILAPLASGAAGIGPLTALFYQPIPIAANGGVTQIGIHPVPEGPPNNSAAPTVAQLKPYIPDPLPAPLNQWFCNVGGDLVVILGNGKHVVYGPCYRPASMNRLWAEIVFLETHGQCAPRCGPGGEPGP
jgi:hypothetical protein